MVKKNIDELAILGGEKLFQIPISTSNLLNPDQKKFLKYLKIFYSQKCEVKNNVNEEILEERLAQFHQTNHCITFSSGFWGLANTIKAIALKDKTEIIMPSLTYRRMADIAAWVPLKPKFCEVDPSSLAMTAATVKECINENTAVILGVHPIVNCSDSQALVDLANEMNIPICFDSVESVFETNSSGRVGGFGRAEGFSIHACKLLNGFGGGYVTTNDEELAKHLHNIKNYGLNEDGVIDQKYGMNSSLNEMHCALTLSSLDDVESQVEKNEKIYHKYKSLLAAVPEVRLLNFDENYKNGFKNIVVEILEAWPLSREDTIRILNSENILVRAHYYPPLHQREYDFPYVKSELPITDKLAEKFLNLPCGQRVTSEDVEKFINLLIYVRDNANQIKRALKKATK